MAGSLGFSLTACQLVVSCVIAKCELIAFTSATPKPILRAVKSPDSNATSAHPLAELQRGEAALVAGLAEVASFDDGQGSGPVVLARLRDLGFVAGARCEVMAKMWPAGDPMVIRVGGSTFALRRAEAAAVQVTRLTEEPAVQAALAPRDTGAALA